MFQSPEWAALREGLHLVREEAVYKALHAKDLSLRDEARGVANALEDVLDLERAMQKVHEIYRAVAGEDKK
jgi:hypothetical protein